jgi:hypothetical protein
MLKNASCNGKWKMGDGKAQRFEGPFPFSICHFPSRPPFFGGLVDRATFLLFPVCQPDQPM